MENNGINFKVQPLKSNDVYGSLESAKEAILSLVDVIDSELVVSRYSASDGSIKSVIGVHHNDLSGKTGWTIYSYDDDLMDSTIEELKGMIGSGTGGEVNLSNYYTKKEVDDKVAFVKTDNDGAKMSNCTASGEYAVAEGAGTRATGTNSHAEGYYTTASGDYSHAEGNRTIASGLTSHAEGNGTKASGVYSHAEGGNTTASSWASHAEGGATTASGDYSHTEGYGTSATTQSEHASGQYNISLSGSSSFGYSGNTLFTVGNGYNTGKTHNTLQMGTIYLLAVYN